LIRHGLPALAALSEEALRKPILPAKPPDAAPDFDAAGLYTKCRRYFFKNCETKTAETLDKTGVLCKIFKRLFFRN
jgi:hypothetical protein